MHTHSRLQHFIHPSTVMEPLFAPSNLRLSHFGESKHRRRLLNGDVTKQRGLQRPLPACEGAAQCFRCDL